MNPLSVSLRQLENHPVRLEGEIDGEALEIETLDELIELAGPFRYAIEVELNRDALLVAGDLELGLHCHCARCLKRFDHAVRLEGWSAIAPLEGEESVKSQGDWVDLTSLLRDDVVLAFPQHPLCDASCGGLASPEHGSTSVRHVSDAEAEKQSVWSDLDRLRL